MTPDERIASLQARVLHDAWLEGSARYWEGRARQLEAARPTRAEIDAAPAEPPTRWVADIDWDSGWPSECPIAACQAITPPQKCRHQARRRRLRPDELPQKLVQVGSSRQDLVRRHRELTAAADACRNRATGLDDAATRDFLDTLASEVASLPPTVGAVA